MPISMLSSSLSLSDGGEELSTNHQISYLHGGPFLLVSALHTSIIAYNLIWTGKWPYETYTARGRERERWKERKEGERENGQNEHSMLLITSTCPAQELSAGTMRWITNRGVYLSLWMAIWFIHGSQSDTIPTQTFKKGYWHCNSKLIQCNSTAT